MARETSISKISKSHLNNLDKKGGSSKREKICISFSLFSLIWQLDLHKTLQEKRLICARGNRRFWLETSQAISQVRSGLLPELEKKGKTGKNCMNIAFNYHQVVRAVLFASP